ncbi:MAG TPA: V-type ATP synthase subunit F [Candidatus Acidoferrum sp.]|nr:V-type ATP synthase subunit F [Candidatus Acidoferrum sp.]
MLGFVIGDSDMITGFRLVGVEGVEVTSVEEASQSLNKAVGRSDLALVIISEEFSTQKQIHEIIEQLRRERRNLLIVEIPGSKGKPSETKMSDLISKTLGVRI